MIDWILGGQGVRIESSAVVAGSLSDHQMVTASVRWMERGSWR
ncbi:MAG: hypothetical protein AAF725_07985 [Acidobacteriota bacterium]